MRRPLRTGIAAIEPKRSVPAFPCMLRLFAASMLAQQNLAMLTEAAGHPSGRSACATLIRNISRIPTPKDPSKGWTEPS